MKVTIELPKPGVPFTCKLLLLAALQEAEKGNCIVEWRVTVDEYWSLVSIDEGTEERHLRLNYTYRIQPPPPFQYKAEITVPDIGASDMLEMLGWIKKQYNTAGRRSYNKKLACKVEITFNEVVETPKPPKLKSTVRRM